MNPVRVQRTRKKGGGIPDGAVYVGRPSKWGNPFHTHGDGYPYSPTMAVKAFRDLLEEQGAYFPNDIPRQRIPVAMTTVDDIKRELCGKSLACWCPLGQPCHADVLLEIANS